MKSTLLFKGISFSLFFVVSSIFGQDLTFPKIFKNEFTIQTCLEGFGNPTMTFAGKQTTFEEFTQSFLTTIASISSEKSNSFGISNDAIRIDSSEELVAFSNSVDDAVTCGFFFEELLCDDTLVLTGLPEYGSFSWINSSGETIGTAESITITEAGMYTLIATDDSCSNIVEHWQVIPCEWHVSDAENRSKVSVFPNPTYGKNDTAQAIGQASILDVSAGLKIGGTE